MTKINLSVALIVKNEEDRLPATLKAIRDIASEIVVVDCGSTDKTIEIAKNFNAKVYFHPWEGFAKQKNYLTQLCTCNWILFLDADEVITDKLREEIIKTIRLNQNFGYEINRKVFYLGRILHYSWQKNYRLRLVKRDQSPKWIGSHVHEELTITQPTKKLRNHLIHFSYRDINDHFSRTVTYAKLSALDYYERKKSSSIVKILLKPLFSFFRSYFLKLGLLDGFPGLIASVSSSFYTFLKYSILYELQNKSNAK